MKGSAGVVRGLALLLAALLACMTTLSWSSEPACIEISSLAGLDDGQTVVVNGLLVDLRTNDGGSESLVLSDVEETAAVWVFVSTAIGPPPSAYARIGDKLRVVGSLSVSRSGAALFSDSDSVTLLERAEEVLTVGSLSAHWELFLGDEVRLRGLLIQPNSGEGLRLMDFLEECSLSVRPACDWDDGLLGFPAIVSGRLVLDQKSMSIVIEADSIHE